MPKNRNVQSRQTINRKIICFIRLYERGPVALRRMTPDASVAIARSMRSRWGAGWRAILATLRPGSVMRLTDST